MPYRLVVLAAIFPYLLGAQVPSRVQPGTPASQAPEPRIETVEANHNAVITDTYLISGAPYTPATAEDRVELWARRSFALDNHISGVFKIAWKTWVTNDPAEWGKGLDGYARRYATREFEVIVANGVEAGVGAIWGEDPRYFRLDHGSLNARIRHAIISSYMTHRRDGSRGPAYARFIGMMSAKGSSMIWYPDESKNWRRPTVSAIGIGLAGRIGSNLFREFKPDLMRMVRKNKK